MRGSQQGFALIEILIALAIGTAIIGVTLSTMSQSSRAITRISDAAETGRSLRNIEALLRAGVPLSTIRLEYPSWSVEPAEDPGIDQDWLETGQLQRIEVSKPGDALHVDIWIPANERP